MDELGNVTGMGDITLGADDASPLPDVSNGAQDMQPETPTGNGSGLFIDGAAVNKTLGQVLNYAILRDQLQMSRQPTAMQMGALQTQALQARTQSRNSTLLLLLAVGAGVILLAR